MERDEIVFKQPVSLEGVVWEEGQQFFPTHFLGLIVGKPGSGKTTLLKQLLTDKRLMFKKFNQVLVLSPSVEEYGDFFLPAENLNNKLDVAWIIDSIKKCESGISYKNVLVILDDLVVDVRSDESNSDLKRLIFNRRHILKNGMVSILITSQKYKIVPPAIRVALSFIIFFKVSPSELDVMTQELVHSNMKLEKIAAKCTQLGGKFVIYNSQDELVFFNFKKYEVVLENETEIYFFI